MNANSNWDSIPPSFSRSDRPAVVDRTGLRGRFDLYLELDLNWDHLVGELSADTLRSNAAIFDAPPSGWPQTNYSWSRSVYLRRARDMIGSVEPAFRKAGSYVKSADLGLIANRRQ